jgi:hypothetical protein
MTRIITSRLEERFTSESCVRRVKTFSKFVSPTESPNLGPNNNCCLNCTPAYQKECPQYKPAGHCLRYAHLNLYV